MKIHEQITRETWMKGKWRQGDARCLLTWCATVYDIRTMHDVLSSLQMAIHALPGHTRQSIVGFNDAPETTFEDILRLCKLADV